MEKIINKTQKLGEIVSIFPGATQIFNRYKLDYCCGGQDTLGDASAVLSLDSSLIIEELNTKFEKFINTNSSYKDWRKETPSSFITHIVNVHHDFTKKHLKEIDTMLFKVLKVHFRHHGEELLQVHKLFGALKTELEEHLVKEEELLFPLIKNYELSKDDKILSDIHKVINDTEAEHDTAGDILKELERITRDFNAPEGSCTTFKLVYTKLHELEKDLFIHIHLENSILFDMF